MRSCGLFDKWAFFEKHLKWIPRRPILLYNYPDHFGAEYLLSRCVVHCLVSNLPSTSGAGSQQQASARSGVADHHHHHNQGAAHGHHHQVHHHGQPLDVSAFFIPLLGLALAMVWYLALAYNSYFNFMSTTALLGLTSLYFLSVYGTHFHVNVAVRTAVPPEPHQ